MNRYLRTLAVALVVTNLAVASAQPDDVASQQYPDVVGVEVQPRGTNRFDFRVTISSPYDTRRRYADGFRVMNRDGHHLAGPCQWHQRTRSRYETTTVCLSRKASVCTAYAPSVFSTMATDRN